MHAVTRPRFASALAVALLAHLTSAAFAQDAAPSTDCDEVAARIASTYDFVPSELTSDEQRDEKGAAMTAFWEWVEARQETALPCLREALQADDAQAWFRFDGASLLVSLDDSEASRDLQVELWTDADLDGIDKHYWLATMVRRGAQGHDTTRAAERWLNSRMETFSPWHAMRIDAELGGLFLYSTLPPELAVPSLALIALEEGHRRRDAAAELLASQATPLAWRTLAALEPEGLSMFTRKRIEQLAEGPTPIPPHMASDAEVPRETLVAALEKAVLAREAGEFGDAHDDTGLNEREWVAVAARTLQEQDAPMLRRLLRRRMASVSDEALYDRERYVIVLQHLTWKAEYFE